MTGRFGGLTAAVCLALIAIGCFEETKSSHPCGQCLPCEECLEGPAGPQCSVVSHAYQQCDADGNVRWYDSCDNDEGVAELCPEQNAECVDGSAGESECVCNTHWEGDDCDVCPGNWDPAQDCDECQTNWEGEDCEVCPGNWDPASNCSECANQWIDEDNDCGTCPGNWDPDADCGQCIDYWDPDLNCEVCLGNWDLATDCTSCLNMWVDDDDDCGTCPENWDPEQDCAACLPGWEGASCDLQPQCVRYVDIASAADEPNGHGWVFAFTSVQEGIDAAVEAVAAPDGPEECAVWVAAGSYFIYETSSANTVALAAEAPLYGGFAGDETELEQRDWIANQTVLDGRETFSSSDRVYHVVVGADGALIDGFVVQYGQADGSSDENYNRGGGLYAFEVSPVVRNCTFQSNAAESGGGIYLSYTAAELENVELNYNSADYGGGLTTNQGSPTITGCSFLGNVAGTYGGAGYLSHSDIGLFETTFAENDASNRGGALYNFGSSVEIADCTFTENTASYSGAAVYHSSYGGEFLVHHSLFEDNAAGLYGGGILLGGGEPSVVSCVFAGNSAVRGGGVHSVYLSVPNLSSSTFYGNTAEEDGGAVYNDNLWGVVFVGSIFWGNEPNQIYQELGDLSVSYSLVEGGFAGPGNINADPLFVDTSAGDLRLQSGSPCIDAADGTAAPELDINGNPRVDDPGSPNTGVGPPWADMGAYEYQPD